MHAATLLDHCWQQYTKRTPQAARIHAALQKRGEQVHNDHIALRTINDPRCDHTVLARPWLRLGWTLHEDYQFPEKQLEAISLLPPTATLPRIFISHLVLEAMSEKSQATIMACLNEVPADFATRSDSCYLGRPWGALDYARWERLAQETEYGAWLCAHGFVPNHFTIAVHQLRRVADVEACCQIAEESGARINEQGGRLKGDKATGLIQASTHADTVAYHFADGVHRIPSCYYEFAQRYMVNGRLFEGFVPNSANHIFTSTDRHKPI